VNILELCLSPDLGGLELYAYRSSEALASNNDVFAVLTQNSKLDHYYQDNSSIKTLYIKRFFSALPLLNAIRLAKMIDINKIDVIHMHWGKDLPLAAFAKVFSKRKPALVYTRQMMITRSKNDFYHAFQYRQMDLMLTITKELEALCQQYIPQASDRITILYHGVKRPDRFLNENEIALKREEAGFDKNDFIVGLFGRIKEAKGQYLLIDAIKKLAKKHNNIKALVVGHPMSKSYLAKLKADAIASDISENIIFNGFVDNVSDYMQLCDCIVLASNKETFGLVLIEAMNADIAVIGTNSGGVPEIIEHEKTGLLFPPRDSDALAAQIERYIENQDFKLKMALAGKEVALNKFNHEKHYQQLEKIFSELA